MPKRIKLLINPSGVEEGVTYVVHRSATSPVDMTGTPAFEVNEKECKKRILKITGEVLVQDNNSPLEFFVNWTFMWSPAPTVYIDGVQIPDTDVDLYPKDRKIRINNQQITPWTSKVITMDYFYLASEVEDDSKVSQVGVDFKVPLVPTGLNPPPGADYKFDKITRELNINIKGDHTPHNMYYKMYLRQDATGKVSEMSDENAIAIAPNIADIRYTLEKSEDNGATWEWIGTSTSQDYFLRDTNDVTNFAHVPLPITVRPQSKMCYVDVQNPWFEWEKNTRPTILYRVRTEDISGEVSDWTYLPRGQMNYKPMKVRVRRKEHNGTPAQYDGLDAITLWELYEADWDPSQPIITLTDDHLVSGKTYSYTFYIDDERGFRSNPFYETTLIP